MIHSAGLDSVSRIVLQCSRLWNDVDNDSISDSDTEFDAALMSTNDVISDVTAADGTAVISAEQVISEIESMLDVGSFMLIVAGKIHCDDCVVLMC